MIRSNVADFLEKIQITFTGKAVVHTGVNKITLNPGVIHVILNLSLEFSYGDLRNFWPVNTP